MPDIVHSIVTFKIGADGLRGKYDCIEQACIGLQQAGIKQDLLGILKC